PACVQPVCRSSAVESAAPVSSSRLRSIQRTVNLHPMHAAAGNADADVISRVHFLALHTSRSSVLKGEGVRVARKKNVTQAAKFDARACVVKKPDRFRAN